MAYSHRSINLFCRVVAWEKKAAEVLRAAPQFEHIEFNFLTLSAAADELNDNIIKMIPYLLSSSGFVAMYIFTTLLMKDWSLSKPWLGFAGVVAACLAAIASHGLLLAVGLPFIVLNMTLPFILIGKTLVVTEMRQLLYLRDFVHEIISLPHKGITYIR